MSESEATGTVRRGPLWIGLRNLIDRIKRAELINSGPLKTKEFRNALTEQPAKPPTTSPATPQDPSR